MKTSAQDRAERRLAAILAADLAGYSRLMEQDEEGTLARLKEVRALTIHPAVSAHRGRVFKTTGDGLLVEFASVVEAMRCAISVQRDLAERNSAEVGKPRLDFRIGVHVGDVIVEQEGDVYV